MKCPHCSYVPGHYGKIEYKCIDNLTYVQSYWFCHTCAYLIYEGQPTLLSK